ncbi:hypothetical protein H5V45_21160 [Nocardioides sp. KIGAM211]|uniref:Uncharacterized protein n=1 Tax=Nocardioides luti TaxID=2761101 RepID=A0A7X0RK75_9ACTN|nr:hypothetical protein [Nocardioides luti]MBB6629841.1 hypothetical protein [Nocardioides luti]
MTTSPARRAAVLLTTLLAAGAGLAAAPAQATAPASHAAAASRAGDTTTVTFTVPDCLKCEITLHQAIQGRQKVWQTKTKRAHDGAVTFTIPTKRTHGLDATIQAPWEGANGTTTGYVSQVVFRYGHEKPGSDVSSYADVKAKKRGSACWAGTDASDVTIPLEVRKVSVEGTTGPTKATAAWTSTTQDFWAPMERTFKGIFGTQDVPFCAQP